MIILDLIVGVLYIFMLALFLMLTVIGSLGIIFGILVLCQDTIKKILKKIKESR